MRGRPVAASDTSTTWWGWLSGFVIKKKAPKDPIVDLKSQIDMLQQRATYIENAMDEHWSLARVLVKADKYGQFGSIYMPSTPPNFIERRSVYPTDFQIRTAKRPEQHFIRRSSTSSLSKAHYVKS